MEFSQGLLLNQGNGTFKKLKLDYLPPQLPTGINFTPQFPPLPENPNNGEQVLEKSTATINSNGANHQPENKSTPKGEMLRRTEARNCKSTWKKMAEDTGLKETTQQPQLKLISEIMMAASIQSKSGGDQGKNLPVPKPPGFPIKLQRIPKSVKDYSHMCPGCNIPFDKTKILPTENIESGLEETLVFCNVCDKKYKIQFKLLTIVQSGEVGELIPPIYRCCTCNVESDFRLLMFKHIKLYHIGIPCDKCDESFFLKIKLSEHKKMTHVEEDKKIKCETCGIIFPSYLKLKGHEIKHKDDRPFVCPFCPKSFKTNIAMQKHLITHTGERHYKCKLCPADYRQLHNLARHKFTCHGVGTKRHLCHDCGKTFFSTEELKSHIVIHEGESAKIFQCHLCEKSFSNRPRLNSHIRRRHTGGKPFKCTFCQKLFKISTQLETHVRVHTGEKPFKCDLCDNAFVAHGALSRHMLIHTGEQPYSCKICNMRFNQSSSLKRHGLVHNKE